MELVFFATREFSGTHCNLVAKISAECRLPLDMYLNQHTIYVAVHWIWEIFKELQTTPSENISQTVNKKVRKKPFLRTGYFINVYYRVSNTSSWNTSSMGHCQREYLRRWTTALIQCVNSYVESVIQRWKVRYPIISLLNHSILLLFPIQLLIKLNAAR